MSRRISVIGTGYVGLVTAVGLADFGNTVLACDIDKKIIEKLSKGIPTIFEHGLEEYLKRNIQAGRLIFSSQVDECIKNTDVVFVGVGTPDLPDGSVDLSQIDAVVDAVVRNMNGHKIIAIKSTVSVGTNRRLEKRIAEETGSTDFAVISNPEFLREGKAMQDFFHPDRVVIGCENESAKKAMEEIYRPLYLIQTPFVWCNFETAELIKYASNAFLATKISFINQMANLAEALGADIHQVAKTMGMDGRISPKFLHPGPGYGGSCFPKDTKAVVDMGRKQNVQMSVVEEVIRANDLQKKRIVDRLRVNLGTLKDKTVAILGVAFKAETDDIRESPVITVVNELLQEEAQVRVHDPKALANFEKLFGNRISYSDDILQTIHNADCFLVITEWNSYRSIDLSKARDEMRGNLIFDTRNVLDPERAKKCGFNYIGTGR
jgi:UDPglucose 6-dehydrogenase